MRIILSLYPALPLGLEEKMQSEMFNLCLIINAKYALYPSVEKLTQRRRDARTQGLPLYPLRLGALALKNHRRGAMRPLSAPIN